MPKNISSIGLGFGRIKPLLSAHQVFDHLQSRQGKNLATLPNLPRQILEIIGHFKVPPHSKHVMHQKQT